MKKQRFIEIVTRIPYIERPCEHCRKVMRIAVGRCPQGHGLKNAKARYCSNSCKVMGWRHENPDWYQRYKNNSRPASPVAPHAHPE